VSGRSEAEIAELKDRLLRSMADQENARKRAERDREEAVRYALSALARDLLTTVDNLRRAIESIAGTGEDNETLRPLMAGVARNGEAPAAASEQGARRPSDHATGTALPCTG
jgi:molecular chaperone GrpE